MIQRLFSILMLLCCAATSLNAKNSGSFEFRTNEKIAVCGGSLAERMNLFGHLESCIHLGHSDKQLEFRNFGWPADEVGNQQRPNNYTRIDNPFKIFGPELIICMFGFNEHFAGDSEQSIKRFETDYRKWIDQQREQFSTESRPLRFVLVSPIAFESTSNSLLPDGEENNRVLKQYAMAVKNVASSVDMPYVDLMTPTLKEFGRETGAQYTINGVHLNEAGDKLVSTLIYQSLFPNSSNDLFNGEAFERVRSAVNDKSWFHLQDYRMLNGWYVYGGRRTWDKQTFPGEFRKIRKMVAVRDRYIWAMASGKSVPDHPDDSQTGEVFIPETMFGTRDDNFRRMREPTSLEYPSPEDSIAQMSVPDGMEVQLFASEREFPELANPTQMTFDSKGRLWVSCMVNYPQWLPGSAKPGDKLLIFEDTDKDGRADVCKTFYDGLICPTGFEFYQDGVLVVNEPRIVFLRDTDGDDVVDEVVNMIDGIATDDTHHAMGAWEWSHGGNLHMLEGIAMSTTMETPWGPFRNKGPSGGYVFDPLSWRFSYFKTPGYGNPWCMVFDRWGMGVVGDGTNAQQHWTSPLSGYNVGQRKTLRPNFNNEGMRPAVGNEFLLSRHFPDQLQGQFTYACVINMHGLPKFEFGDEDGTAGYSGKRVDDLIDSTDNFFRPIDPQIGPDGALWFGDWCNALIGHMQYSQRDPNRDHQHGRIYRLVNKNKGLLEPELQAGKPIEKLLEQLASYELRTRYRARRELRSRDKKAVLSALRDWITDDASDEILCEAMWLQESFRELDPALIDRILRSDDFHARSAAVHTVTNERLRFKNAMSVYNAAIKDEHPRVRLEALRGLSFVRNKEAAQVSMSVLNMPMDYWLTYTLEHTLHALSPFLDLDDDLANFSNTQKEYYFDFLAASKPGGLAARHLKQAQNPELPKWKHDQAVSKLAQITGGKKSSGKKVYEIACSGCHMIQGNGKSFGPALDGLAIKYNREEIINHILYPNETIAKGFETVQVLTMDGEVMNGFVLEENDTLLSLGVATDDGKGKRVDIDKEEIDELKEMKASSMPEGLVKTIAASEFLDLVEYLSSQYADKDNWIGTKAGKSELRSVSGFKEISRDAKVRIGDNFPGHWNKEVHLLLNPTGARDFAFHSPQPAINEPHIVIKLSKPSEIRLIEIQNRRTAQFHERAKGLTVSISTDGKDWKPVWKAADVAADYTVTLPSGTNGQFVKIGLDRKGIFHLNQVSVFGK